MKSNRQNEMEGVFGPVIYSYTRARAIEDGVLVDVSETAQEAGLRYPMSLTRAVFDQYVAVPKELDGLQDEAGRLWDILWMLSCAIRSRQLEGDQGTFEVIVASPAQETWRVNEKPFEGSRDRRLVTLKAVCGPSDDGSPCLTIMRPEED